MICKLIAICIFMYISIKVSYDMKKNLKNRYIYITDIISGLKYLKKEITVFSNYLGVALKNSALYAGNADILFIHAGEKIISDPSSDLGNLFVSYVKDKDIRLFHKLRNGILGNTMNLPGKGGRKVSVAAYRIAQKVVGFN